MVFISIIKKQCITDISLNLVKKYSNSGSGIKSETIYFFKEQRNIQLLSSTFMKKPIKVVFANCIFQLTLALSWIFFLVSVSVWKW